MNLAEKIKRELENNGITLSPDKAEILAEYMSGILEWNEKVNLTAITEEDDFIKKHIVDSLTICGIEALEKAGNIIDIGTGGGFPGIPLAVVYPEKKVVLLDSLEKRLNIIEELCEKLGIKNVETLHARAEDAGQSSEYREGFDLCVSRAVANMSVLAEYTLPFVKKGGCLIAYKGKEIEEELNEAKRSIGILGGEIESILDSATEQKLVVIKKVESTPKKYPRKAGDPKRKPL